MRFTDGERASFATALRTARNNAGLSLSRLAAAVSTDEHAVSPQNIASWEKGTVPFHLSTVLPRLERALDIPKGTLTEALQAPPAASTMSADVSNLEARVTRLEDRLSVIESGQAEPARPRLRAADSDTPDDPGTVRDVSPTRRRRTSADPDEP